MKKMYYKFMIRLCKIGLSITKKNDNVIKRLERKNNHLLTVAKKMQEK